MTDPFQPPTTCVKCKGTMEEGFTVDNNKPVHDGYPAYGKKVKLGGSSSWWRLVPAEPNAKAGLLGEFAVARVLAGEPYQVFTYRCSQCGYLEAYAPSTQSTKS